MQGVISSFVLVLMLVLGFILGESAAKIAFFGLLLSFAFSLAINFFLRNKLTVSIRTDGWLKDRKVQCRINCSNGSNLPIVLAMAKMEIENTFTGEILRENLFFSVPRKKEIELCPEIEIKWSGKYRAEIKNVKVRDILGITALKTRGEDRCFFTALPELLDVNVEYNIRESNTFDNESYSPYKKGQDRSEVFQIRDYEEGDDLRQIHWKLTSKLDKVMVKDPSMPLDKKLMVVMDKSLAEECTYLDCEQLAEVTLSIAEKLIEDGITYKLFWNNPLEETIHEEEIQFEHELMTAISGFLEGGPKKSNENFADLYAKLYDSVDFTHVIYISIDQKILEEEAFGNALVTQIVSSQPNYKDVCSFIALG